ncbi:uncharacterized protein LOC123290934 [Chrysoperla carnea]|uniref:uncharacterized protein LOC123290934 n=1 Tax=Chrysoperla carnea TaxID=189513 RepID=UPI001D062804|nr:uncharacterized protein LOC123290934 [Chrysoperla carnea]
MEKYDGIKDPVWDLQDLKMKKVNKTHYALDGIYTVLRDNIPREDIKMSFYAARRKGNGYEPLPFAQLHKKDFCDCWENDQFVMPAIKNSINETNYKCPPLKGTFALVKYIPDTSKIPANILDGLYRINYEFYNKEEMVGGYKIHVELQKDKNLDAKI